MSTAETLTMAEALKLWRRGNDAGRGYAPYTDEPGEDTIDAAIAHAEADGWTLEMPRESSDSIAVLRDADGAVMGIGGDAMGRNAWAVMLSDEQP